MFAIPAALDTSESTLKNIANIMILPSIVQMLRSTIFIYCALLAVFFLKKRLYKHHWTSMSIIITGVLIVGIAYFIDKDDSNKTYSPTDQIIGLIILQIGQILGAFAYIAEEKFIGDSEDLDPLQIVGYEGIAGIIIWITLLPILNVIPCSAKSLCNQENSVIESSLGAFRDYAANPILIGQSIFLCLDVTILNVAGVSTTKYGSAAQRTTCDMLRNIVVWVLLMNVAVEFEDGKPKYDTFSWIQLAGFIVLVFGILMYNELIVLPIWGLNKNTKIAIEERTKYSQEERKSISY